MLATWLRSGSYNLIHKFPFCILHRRFYQARWKIQLRITGSFKNLVSCWSTYFLLGWLTRSNAESCFFSMELSLVSLNQKKFKLRSRDIFWLWQKRTWICVLLLVWTLLFCTSIHCVGWLQEPRWADWFIVVASALGISDGPLWCFLPVSIWRNWLFMAYWHWHQTSPDFLCSSFFFAIELSFKGSSDVHYRQHQCSQLGSWNSSKI